MKKVLAAATVGLMPVLALAQNFNPNDGVTGLLNWFKGILNMLVPILIAVAVIWFIWNVFKYVIVENDDDKEKARSSMIWGIIAIAVMVSVWGLVRILTSTFNTTGVSPENLNNLIP